MSVDLNKEIPGAKAYGSFSFQQDGVDYSASYAVRPDGTFLCEEKIQGEGAAKSDPKAKAKLDEFIAGKKKEYGVMSSAEASGSADKAHAQTKKATSAAEAQKKTADIWTEAAGKNKKVLDTSKNLATTKTAVKAEIKCREAAKKSLDAEVKSRDLAVKSAEAEVKMRKLATGLAEKEYKKNPTKENKATLDKAKAAEAKAVSDLDTAKTAKADAEGRQKKAGEDLNAATARLEKLEPGKAKASDAKPKPTPEKVKEKKAPETKPKGKEEAPQPKLAYDPSTSSKYGFAPGMSADALGKKADAAKAKADGIKDPQAKVVARKEAKDAATAEWNARVREAAKYGYMAKLNPQKYGKKAEQATFAMLDAHDKMDKAGDDLIVTQNFSKKPLAA